jgi:hypothetical protein
MQEVIWKVFIYIIINFFCFTDKSSFFNVSSPKRKDYYIIDNIGINNGAASMVRVDSNNRSVSESSWMQERFLERDTVLWGQYLRERLRKAANKID